MMPLSTQQSNYRPIKPTCWQNLLQKLLARDWLWDLLHMLYFPLDMEVLNTVRPRAALQMPTWSSAPGAYPAAIFHGARCKWRCCGFDPEPSTGQSTGLRLSYGPSSTVVRDMDVWTSPWMATTGSKGSNWTFTRSRKLHTGPSAKERLWGLDKKSIFSTFMKSSCSWYLPWVVLCEGTLPLDQSER